jgi:hypothetical protein
VDHNVPYVPLFSFHWLTFDDRYLFSTVSRKDFTTVESFISEPDSRAQCAALEENVKEFGLTYFGLKDRRQGMLPGSKIVAP